MTKGRCEDADKDCPHCRGACVEVASVTLTRVDMDDYCGTPFCERCSEDAWESGLFTVNS
jgi:hypothetical protein